tara:strand:- start:510 stop:620 length:111 start_codon:yes stop_codon:yes gene_type:complete
LNVVSKTAGVQTITDEKNTFDSNGIIELTHRSNDDN